jgi:hypothetical protein
MRKIFVVAPGGVVTGGPELLHQFADTLNRETPRARMLYAPFSGHFETPEPYRRYDAPSARVADVKPGSLVILPEVYATLVDHFPGSRVHFWWLSVDSFNAGLGRTTIGRHIGRRIAGVRMGKLRRHVAMHFYQSDYAHHFLQSAALAPTAKLSDYLADEYVQAIGRPSRRQRDNLLVYNPAKGRRQTRLILRALARSSGPRTQMIPLVGMTREQVRDVLGRAKVYIDFGGHPGKDRIPREAAAMGACVIVNRRGSAGNSVDIPIPNEFKIDDRRRGFEMLVVERIKTLMTDFDRHTRSFDAYRQAIAREPASFAEDVRTLFPLDA